MNIGIENLREGMILGKDVYVGNSHVPLLTKGEELDERKISYLSNIPDLEDVYISLSKVNETIPHDLKENAIMALKTRDTELTIGCAKRIASTMESNNEYSYDLVKYVVENFDLDEMTLDICEFAVAFGKIYNEQAKLEDKINLDDLAIAALLHNVGAYFRTHMDEIDNLPLVSLSKKMFPNFTSKIFDIKKKSEYSVLNEPVYAYSLLRDVGNISHNSKVGILLQCETDDGKGPLGLPLSSTNHPGKTIAQIICISGLYERLLLAASKDPTRKPSDVLIGMRTAADSNKINQDLTNLFLEKMPLYSIGIEVVLNDGTIAEVIENTKDTEFPVVKVNSRKYGINSIYDDGAILDLVLYKENIYITGIYSFGLEKQKDDDVIKR